MQQSIQMDACQESESCRVREPPLRDTLDSRLQTQINELLRVHEVEVRRRNDILRLFPLARQQQRALGLVSRLPDELAVKVLVYTVRRRLPDLELEAWYTIEEAAMALLGLEPAHRQTYPLQHLMVRAVLKNACIVLPQHYVHLDPSVDRVPTHFAGIRHLVIREEFPEADAQAAGDGADRLISAMRTLETLLPRLETLSMLLEVMSDSWACRPRDGQTVPPIEQIAAALQTQAPGERRSLRIYQSDRVGPRIAIFPPGLSIKESIAQAFEMGLETAFAGRDLHPYNDAYLKVCSPDYLFFTASRRVSQNLDARTH